MTGTTFAAQRTRRSKGLLGLPFSNRLIYHRPFNSFQSRAGNHLIRLPSDERMHGCGGDGESNQQNLVMRLARRVMPRPSKKPWWICAGPRLRTAKQCMTLIALSFVCFAISGAFLFLGTKWARSAMFPLFFLAFFIPLPEIVVDTLEEASKQASAEVASWLFLITGTPFLRTEKTMFQLPGITIVVAKECSGIRSSLVLIITSLLAANMIRGEGFPRRVFLARRRSTAARFSNSGPRLCR